MKQLWVGGCTRCTDNCNNGGGDQRCGGYHDVWFSIKHKTTRKYTQLMKKHIPKKRPSPPTILCINGNCIVTMCYLMLRMLIWNFWLKKASPLNHTLHTVQISHYATFGCSLRQKKIWKGNTLSMKWPHLRHLRRFQRHFHKKTSQAHISLEQDATAFQAKVMVVHGQNIECLSPNGQFANILFTNPESHFLKTNYRKDIFWIGFSWFFFSFFLDFNKAANRPAWEDTRIRPIGPEPCLYLCPQVGMRVIPKVILNFL